jgi:hypothetical protein
MLSLQDLHAQLDEALAINSVESSFSYEYYTDLINEQRSLWLRNEYNKNRSIDPYIIQNLPCLELELVNPIDCCVDVPEGCKLLRTKKQIPNTIEFYYTKGIVSIGSPDILQARLVLIDYSRVPFVGHGRTTQNSVYAFLYNKYLYFFSKSSSYKLMKYVTARVLLEDPTELQNFTDCTSGEVCFKYSNPYPINLWMWAYIKPYIIQQLMQKSSNKMDDANNAEDGRTEPTAT